MGPHSKCTTMIHSKCIAPKKLRPERPHSIFQSDAILQPFLSELLDWSVAIMEVKKQAEVPWREAHASRWGRTNLQNNLVVVFPYCSMTPHATLDQ